MTGWCSSMLPDNQQKTEIAQNAVDAFSYDHPEVFWIYNVKYSYRISGQSKNSKVETEKTYACKLCI